MSERNGRPTTDASVYFGSQKKQLTVADRRPVIRRASDLVGPGISVYAIPVTDFNNLLATFNGFYSSDGTALNSPVNGEQFIGTVASDETMGGVQTLTSLTTESVWQRVFRRAPGDAETISWGTWRKTSVF